MDKNADITGKHELTYGRGYVCSLQYHLVWCTKYRKKVLWGGHLWNPSYCAVTVSDRSREQVERYILTQKDRA